MTASLLHLNSEKALFHRASSHLKLGECRVIRTTWLKKTAPTGRCPCQARRRRHPGLATRGSSTARLRRRGDVINFSSCREGRVTDA